MIVGKTKRPRNVDAPRAAAILYGDWGTSKAYVIWLGFRGSRLQLILADPGHVRVDGACRRELHGHLPALSGRRGSLRQRSPSIRGYLHGRRLPVDRRLYCHCSAKGL